MTKDSSNLSDTRAENRANNGADNGAAGRVRRTTIFGGSGFIGRYLVRHLAARGDVVKIGVRDPQRAKFLLPSGDVGQIVCLAADIRDGDSVGRLIEDSDVVVNLVGVLRPSRRSDYEDLHHHAPKALAQACRQAGVSRLIHVSALGVTENSSSRYAGSKARGDKAVLQAFPDAVILRPGTIFGREDHFLNRFAMMARFLPALPILGASPLDIFQISAGCPWVDREAMQGVSFQPVYVGDVAQAITKVLEKTDSDDRIFELTGPAVYSCRALMQLILLWSRRRRWLVPVPLKLLNLIGFLTGWLPLAPITLEEARLLGGRMVRKKTAAGFEELGIAPKSMEALAPEWLRRPRGFPKG